jgi:hypothetical protein
MAAGLSGRLPAARTVSSRPALVDRAWGAAAWAARCRRAACRRVRARSRASASAAPGVATPPRGPRYTEVPTRASGCGTPETGSSARRAPRRGTTGDPRPGARARPGRIRRASGEADPQQGNVAAALQPLPASTRAAPRLAPGRGGDRCSLAGPRGWLFRPRRVVCLPRPLQPSAPRSPAGSTEVNGKSRSPTRGRRAAAAVAAPGAPTSRRRCLDGRGGVRYGVRLRGGNRGQLGR